MKFTHIINPVKVSESSDLYNAQPITFETMRRAKAFAKDAMDVRLITAQYPEDREIIPDYFIKTQDLKGSVLDVGTFKTARKLPLIKDILNKAVSYNTSADYIIYTNVDIALMPNFYVFVSQKIEEGYDAFVINRRTISKAFTLETLEAAYNDYGKPHTGYDCFVFKRDLYNKMVLKNICIGTTRIGLALISNLIMLSSKFTTIDEEHLTFHLGEDRVWQNDEFFDYVEHNEKQVIEILKKLRKLKVSKFNSTKLLKKHYTLLESKNINNKKHLFNRIFKTRL